MTDLVWPEKIAAYYDLTNNPEDRIFPKILPWLCRIP
uniref:Uncharacterized protein n=1 Tax=Setaria italica TaxID=4555 RepID=K3XTG1_SETIT